jgi:hypothetical protein
MCLGPPPPQEETWGPRIALTLLPVAFCLIVATGIMIVIYTSARRKINASRKNDFGRTLARGLRRSLSRGRSLPSRPERNAAETGPGRLDQAQETRYTLMTESKGPSGMGRSWLSCFSARQRNSSTTSRSAPATPSQETVLRRVFGSFPPVILDLVLR